MKKLIYLLTVSLFVCMSCSKDEPIEIVNQDEQPHLSLEKLYSEILLKKATLNENDDFSKRSSESENNGNGVNIVAFYSDGGFWSADFPIYEGEILTHFLRIAFPQNGNDTALVFNETEMMVNFTSHDPQMFLVELGPGGQVYSNWCEVDRSGLYKGRGKTGYASMPGNPDVYWWGPNAPVAGDDNYIFHIKATLSLIDGGFCDTDLTESIDFRYTYQGQNGRVRQTSSIH